jgi:site-specific DNA-methyltransferase (adenine-specific)
VADIRQGDNADVMRAMHEAGERFVLVYLDPPFATGRDFETTGGEMAFADRWDSLDHYLEVLTERMRVAFLLLEPAGSIVVHVDPTVSHYVKVRGDELFGRDNFASEIVWRYRRWPAKRPNFQAMHDVLLRWVTGRVPATFNQLFEPLAPSTTRTFKQAKQWAVEREGERGKSRWKSQGTEELSPGAALSDVWEIPIIAPSGNERTGYPTQKPEALIEQLVLATTNEGDRVLSPYMGSGTELAVCHRLGRRCTGIDSSEVAINVARERLAPLEAQGDLFKTRETA